QPPAPPHPAPPRSPAQRSPAQRPAATRTLPLRPTPLLMQGQEYLFRTQPRCLDFQEQAHRLGVVDEGDGSPVPCVLVLARSADMEMNELSIALAERGIRMVRIDADRCTDLPLTVYTDTPLLELDRWLVRPLLVWRRHFELSAVPVEPGTLAGAYAVDQWNAVAGWLSTRRDWAHVNPVRHTAHLDRLTQMADAAAFGLTVPRTAVTTRPGRTRPGGGQCIVKTAGRHLLEPRPGVQHGLFPRPLETSRAGDVPETAPVIVQEYVTAETEIRVFTVDEECLAYQVDKIDPAQLWVDPDAVRVTPVEVPEGLRGRLLALARHWRLQVAAFDLLVAGDDHVFLEVNVNCDWRWFEHRAGDTRVSDAVHSWVAGRFEELLGAGQGR
ncbi:ATP-grasp domain-containing protein, partial [Actinosynnema sp.]|uniref:ATP-grasp domain-containing protein n=1 Tax=Actinosynnema sp. TaxID=1872144 RepID=UPI003F879B37